MTIFRLAVPALILCAAATACKSGPGPSKASGSTTEKSTGETAPAGPDSGLKIYLDEHGNRITPPKGAAAATPAAPEGAAPGKKTAPRTFTTPGGGRGVVLDESTMAQSVGKVTPGGTVKVECTGMRKGPAEKSGKEERRAASSQSAAPSPEKGKE